MTGGMWCAGSLCGHFSSCSIRLSLVVEINIIFVVNLVLSNIPTLKGDPTYICT